MSDITWNTVSDNCFTSGDYEVSRPDRWEAWSVFQGAFLIGGGFDDAESAMRWAETQMTAE